MWTDKGDNKSNELETVSEETDKSPKGRDYRHPRVRGCTAPPNTLWAELKAQLLNSTELIIYSIPIL